MPEPALQTKFFQILPSETKIDFVGKAKFIFLLSVIVIVGSIVLPLTRGLNYGVDFLGGSEIQVRFKANPSAAEVRSVLGSIGLEGAMVQGFGEKGSGEFLVRVPSMELDLRPYETKIREALHSAGTEGAAFNVRFSSERLYVTFPEAVAPEKIQSSLVGLAIKDLSVNSVSPFGKEGNHEYLVQFEGVSARIIKAFNEKFEKENVEILQVEQVGPKVGKELRMQAVGAVLVSLLFILIYVWFRFEFEFAPGAIVALIHDAVLILGLFSLLRLDFDLSVVAAVLTIVGFSINDTIVIYDRVRENLKKLREPDFEKVINISINQTLGRTVLTSGTVLITALALLFMGGPITFNFALAFTIGLISGTYSTVYVALPMTIYVHDYLQRKRA